MAAIINVKKIKNIANLTSIFDVNCWPHSAFNFAIIIFSISSEALFALKSRFDKWDR